MESTDEVLLFSYGTLQQAEVQRATFGRLLAGRAAAVPGYRLEWLTITDPDVITTSGSDRHPLLVADTDTDPVVGTVFTITAEELAAADEYEVDDYARVRVALDTGEEAWVYVFAG